MKYLFICILFTASCWAETLSPKQQALERLFSTLTPEKLKATLDQAQEAGVSQQAILEAHFLHLVEQEDFSGMADLTPKLLKQRDLFNPDDSEIFAVKEDWLAIIHYAQAMKALQNKDKADFKKHITEAFWLSPRQGQAFAPHINQLRMRDSMAAITLKANRTLQTQDGSPNTTLGSLMKNKKGAVLYFWSPMSQEVHQNLDDFILTSQHCEKHNIAVISILVAHTPLILKDAELVRTEDAKGSKIFWAIDPNKNNLSNLLRITDIPTMVVISPEGKILFNGHPEKDNFWKQLQVLNPDFKQPAHTHSHNHDHPHSDG